MKQTQLKTFLNNFTLTHMSRQYRFTEHGNYRIATVTKIEYADNAKISKILVTCKHDNVVLFVKSSNVDIDALKLGDICQVYSRTTDTCNILCYMSAEQYAILQLSPQDKIVSLIKMLDTPIGHHKFGDDIIFLAQALKDDYDVKQDSNNAATCDGFAVTKRKYFVHGDIVIDKSGTAYIYNSPVGFDKASVIDIDGNHLEINIIDNGPLQFHPDFTPGLIAEKFA